MATTFTMGEPVVLLRYSSTEQDYLGNDIPVYTEVPIEHAAVYATDANGYAGNETTGGMDQVIAGLGVLLPPGTDVEPLDRMRIRGQLWEVDGHPNAMRSFFTGWTPGVLCTLRRVEG